MREYLNESTLFNTLAMYLSETNSLAVVVEGDDDHLMLKDHCAEDLILIPGTGGKEQVLRAAELSMQRGLTTARFLVDRDYDDYKDGVKAELINVVYSKTHDCFVDVASSEPKLLDRVVDVITASARRRPEVIVEIPSVDQLISEAFDLAARLAAVRVIDAKRRLLLDFKRFSFGGMKFSELHTAKMAHTVLIRSRKDGPLSVEIAEEAAATYSELGPRGELLVGDHDLFSALSKVLKRFNISVSADDLQRGFILTVNCAALQRTPWFVSLQTWCRDYGRQGFNCDSPLGSAA